jgi:small multidrug resistance family-3 protein
MAAVQTERGLAQVAVPPLCVLDVDGDLAGIASLIGCALALTRVDSAFAGHAYAGHGGIYIAASLVWLWIVERQIPTRADLLGAALAIIGALVIIGFAARVR